MILYNITFKIEHEIHEGWVRFMKIAYIPKMMDTGKFIEHKLCRVLGVDEEDGITYALQFLCPNMVTYQLFQEKDAYKIQKEHALKYQNQYVSFSTTMKVI